MTIKIKKSRNFSLVPCFTSPLPLNVRSRKIFTGTFLLNHFFSLNLFQYVNGDLAIFVLSKFISDSKSMSSTWFVGVIFESLLAQPAQYVTTFLPSISFWRSLPRCLPEQGQATLRLPLRRSRGLESRSVASPLSFRPLSQPVPARLCEHLPRT